MTLVVHELYEVHGGEQWQAWGLDLCDHADFLGEVGVGEYYFPPHWLDADPDCEVVDVEPAYWLVEVPYPVLTALVPPRSSIAPSPGTHGRGRLAGRRIADLDPTRRYAVTWLEIY